MIRRARAVWRGSGRTGNGNLLSDSGVLAIAAGLAASLALGDDRSSEGLPRSALSPGGRFFAQVTAPFRERLWEILGSALPFPFPEKRFQTFPSNQTPAVAQ